MILTIAKKHLNYIDKKHKQQEYSKMSKYRNIDSDDTSETQNGDMKHILHVNEEEFVRKSDTPNVNENASIHEYSDYDSVQSSEDTTKNEVGKHEKAMNCIDRTNIQKQYSKMSKHQNIDCSSASEIQNGDVKEKLHVNEAEFVRKTKDTVNVNKDNTLQEDSDDDSMQSTEDTGKKESSKHEQATQNEEPLLKVTDLYSKTTDKNYNFQSENDSTLVSMPCVDENQKLKQNNSLKHLQKICKEFGIPQS